MRGKSEKDSEIDPNKLGRTTGNGEISENNTNNAIFAIKKNKGNIDNPNERSNPKFVQDAAGDGRNSEKNYLPNKPTSET